MNDEERRKMFNKILLMVLEDVDDYYENFKRPVNMSLLKKRCCRHLRKLDMTITSVVKALHKRGDVFLFISETLARFIVPIDAWNKLTDSEKIIMKNKAELTSFTVRKREGLPKSNFFTKEK